MRQRLAKREAERPGPVVKTATNTAADAAPMPSEAELLEMISEAAYCRGGSHGAVAGHARPPLDAGTRFAPPRNPFRGGSMADDLKQTGKADDQRINVEQDHELSYWSKELGVSREQLRSAVQQAGSLVRDVRRHLSR
jgi:hypothetical protein